MLLLIAIYLWCEGW